MPDYWLEELIALSEWFPEDCWPSPPCSKCKIGELRPRAVYPIEAVGPRENSNHPDWDPEWTYGIFHGELRCNRESCGEVTGGGLVICVLP